MTSIPFGRVSRFATTAVLLSRIAAAQQPARQAPVEVVVPAPPVPAMAGGRRVLAYELHVTNLGQRALAVRSVEVFSSLGAAIPDTVLSGPALRAAFQIGAAMHMGPAPDTLRIDAGARAVVFMWIAANAAARIPALLRHRLTFASLDDGAVSVIDSLVTRVDATPVPVIAAPFRGGEWLAGNGPSDSSAHRRSLIPLNGKAWIAQRFATDWVKIGPNGNTSHDGRSRNENFWGYGEPVLAVADAEVASAVDSMPDNIPGKLPAVTVAGISGNHVILRLSDGRYALYAHLQHGSLKVRRGQRVKRGDVIALLGNSGQATAPHLHFQVMNAPSSVAAEGVPFAFEQFTFEGFGRDYEPDKPHKAIVMRREMPVDDAVVRFPDGLLR